MLLLLMYILFITQFLIVCLLFKATQEQPNSDKIQDIQLAHTLAIPNVLLTLSQTPTMPFLRVIKMKHLEKDLMCLYFMFVCVSSEQSSCIFKETSWSQV